MLHLICLLLTLDYFHNPVNGATEKKQPSVQSSNKLYANLTDNEVSSIFDHHKDVQLEDLSNDLRNWTPPEFFTKNYPCFLSGFDFEDRPIWIAELGKYDMRKLIDKGPAALAEFDKYCMHVARIWTDSHTWKNPEGRTVSVLLDFDGFQLVQYASVPIIRLLIKLAQDFLGLLESHIENLVIINANFVTETLLTVMRPVLGRLIGRAEVYGTDKSVWLPRILRHFPQESLPTWYGGPENFTPVKVIG